MQDFEGLGVFYLGKPVDPVTRKAIDMPLLYKSKDLVTHAVCVGMTGSGKTGLCVGLLEEAALDGIPVIAIDPKGDLANLALTFPALRPEDFRLWIQEDEVRAKGLNAEEFAAQQAELWKNGLAASGQDGARIQRLRDAVDLTIYTPGSEAGIPLSILKSFDAPDEKLAEDKELMRDRVSASVTSLLGLIGMNADPIQSREHVLLSNILEGAWQAGKSLDLTAIIAQIQTPPFERAGVMDLETFYPAKDRFSLAMSFNNLLASPNFGSWLEGAPLDVSSLLYTQDGKPRLSILSIAHLSDPERMFFVSLLLNQMVGWVRAQGGTSSLRAILYMDEIFGFFPPIANPPSKKPLLTLLKQARASGLGVVLATQNPVDLDYKGLSNTGTWFIGRLQTERDKLRVLDGLEGAVSDTQSNFDRRELEKTLAGLSNRTFLLNNIHDGSPHLFQTRWTLSYLRGPMTREGIRVLMSGKQRPKTEGKAKEVLGKPETALLSIAPVLPPDIPQYFIPVLPGQQTIIYKPVLVCGAKLRYVNDKQKIFEEQNIVVLARFCQGVNPIDWEHAQRADFLLDELEKEPADNAQFESLPEAASKAKNYAAWSRAFVTWLSQTQRLELFESPTLRGRSHPGELEREFRIRLQQQAREERDRLTETVRRKYASKLAALEERKRRAEIAAGQQQAQRTQAMLQTAFSMGTGLLSAFLGKKAMSVTTVSRAATAARHAGRSWKESQDVQQATENVEQVAQQLAGMQNQFEEELKSLQSKIDPATEQFETISIRPKKADIDLQLVALGWMAQT